MPFRSSIAAGAYRQFQYLAEDAKKIVEFSAGPALPSFQGSLLRVLVPGV
jgi:hypothetical protein